MGAVRVIQGELKAAVEDSLLVCRQWPEFHALPRTTFEEAALPICVGAAASLNSCLGCFCCSRADCVLLQCKMEVSPNQWLL